MPLFTKTKPANTMTTSAVTLRVALRKLWADHVIWTRQYIIAAVAGTPDAEAAATRLLRNQEDIGGAVASIYGKAAGDKLTGLLKTHINIAVRLVAAAKDSKTTEFSKQDKLWSANGEQIASFLAGANPNWPLKDLSNLLALHLSLTKNEAVARLSSKWDDDVKAFDDIFVEIMTVADALADGIVKQFPEKFEA